MVTVLAFISLSSAQISLLRMPSISDLSERFPLLCSYPQNSNGEHLMETQTNKAMATYDVVIVGAGAGGIAAASSLLKRDPELNVTIIDPSENHFYQPGWTLVGGGVFDFSQTERETAAVIPKSAKWIKQAVRAFTPDQNTVLLHDGKLVEYK